MNDYSIAQSDPHAYDWSKFGVTDEELEQIKDIENKK